MIGSTSALAFTQECKGSEAREEAGPKAVCRIHPNLMANEERPNPSVSLPLVAHVANVAELADDAQDVADQRQRRRARKGAEPPHVDQHRCGAVQRQQRHRCDQQRDRRQQLRKVWRRSRHRCADVGSSAVRPWAAAEKARD
eukprot:scaffold1954_cov268-Pinguiococcus_pyrenoidosus.AAC.53